MRHSMSLRLGGTAAAVALLVAGLGVDAAGAALPRLPGAPAVGTRAAGVTPVKKPGLWGARVVRGAPLTCPRPARTTGTPQRLTAPVVVLFVCPPPTSQPATTTARKPRKLTRGTVTFTRLKTALSLPSFPPTPGQRCPMRPVVLRVVYAGTDRGGTTYVELPTDGCGFTRREVTSALATVFPSTPR